MRVFLINGASGSGKTTLAKALVEQIPEIVWIHPDGLMDTPEMEAEEILSTSLSLARTKETASTVMIDCQIRPSAIDGLARQHPVAVWTMILLDCPREIREERLLKRGWSGQDFERVDSWASVLRSEATVGGHQIFDTSVESVDSVASRIAEELRNGV